SQGNYKYTPLSVGTALGALRELIYHVDDQQQALEIAKRMKIFVQQITKYAGLQLSEVETNPKQEFFIPVDDMGVIRTARLLDNPFGLAPVLASEIVLNREAIANLNAKRPTNACGQARNAFRSAYYYTDIGMYAASELALTARTAQQLSPDPERPSQANNQNPELLNPLSLNTTGAKSGDFSDQNLVHIEAKSSLGIQLQHGPLITQAAQALDLSQEDYTDALLEQYAELTGLETIPEPLLPIFIEFYGGVPEIEYGKETERWRESLMDKSLVPSALGQSLYRQVLWMQEALATRHNDRNMPDPDGQYIGRTAEEGFLALLFAQAAANKIAFLKETMLVPLHAEDVSTPSGKYIPHRLEVSLQGEKPTRYQVEDADSSLFDLTSLLMGVSELKTISDPQGQPPYNDVFGDDKLIPAEVHEISWELVTLLLENLNALHWDSTHRTLYEINSLEKERNAEAPVQPSDNGDQENVISTEQAALAMIALESVYTNFPEDPALQNAAKTLIVDQADFLLHALRNEEDGAMVNGAQLTDDIEPYSGITTLLAQAAGIRSLLIAYQITGDQMYLEAAKQTAAFLETTFWDPDLEVYKTAIGGSQYHYTPLNTGMTIGALRELLAANAPENLEQISQHTSQFFEYVVERIGLQLSEQRQLLELQEDPQTLAPVLAADLIIQPLGIDIDSDVPQPGSTVIYAISFTEDALTCDINDGYIEDMLPEGVTFVRSLPRPASIDDRVIRWNTADLSPDEDGLYTIRLEVRINPLATLDLDYADIMAGIRTWQVNNCASLWCQAFTEREQQVTTACTDLEITLPHIELEKTVSPFLADPGQPLEVELSVSNLSDVTAYSVTIEDLLPEGFIYVDESMRSLDTLEVDFYDTTPLVWVLTHLRPQETVRFSYTVMLDPNVPEGLYTTSAKAYAVDRAGFPFETETLETTVSVRSSQ
ncbi:DUF11 domain-containing protein, partial [candidate division KSB3 bacterium]|nr:DUF11 domain-containing protein [candidate division KSB3 bacterium]MBD3323001.1 DUF11 domain-containing protein [candidate division KSB3 bacterium]